MAEEKPRISRAAPLSKSAPMTASDETSYLIRSLC